MDTEIQGHEHRSFAEGLYWCLLWENGLCPLEDLVGTSRDGQIFMQQRGDSTGVTPMCHSERQSTGGDFTESLCLHGDFMVLWYPMYHRVM